MTDVFISYAHQDHARVNRLVERLRSADLDIWWDEQITPGRNFDDAIEERIMEAKCIVVIWSKHSVNSEWVKNEAMVGLERGCLVPVMIDEVVMPLTFRRTHAIDLRMGHGRNRYDTFLGAVRRVIDGETTESVQRSHQHRHKPNLAKRYAVTSLLAIALIALAFPISNWLKQSSTEITQTALYMVLAVLPFQNLSKDDSNDYFVAGIHEEIIARLSMLDSLSVIARTSVSKYADTQMSIQQISGELNADLIMEGSVRFDGDNVRITAQLIDAKNANHIWSEIYDGELNDIFAVQTDVAKNLANIILSPTAETKSAYEEELLERNPTVNPTAYVKYLVGRHHLDRGRPDLALTNLEEAIALDPNYAAAYVGLAQYWLYQMFWYSVPAEQALPKYLENQRRAYKADPENPDVQSLTMYALLLEGKIAEAQSIRENLINGGARTAENFESLARWPPAPYSERVKWQQKAVNLDPQNTAARWRLSQYLSSNGKFEQALHHIQICNSLEVNPYLLSTTGEILLHLNETKEAHTYFDQAIDIMEARLKNDVPEKFDAVSVLSQLVFMHGKRGNTVAAQEHLSNLEQLSERQYVGPSNMVVAYQGTQDIKKISAWLKRWIDQEGYWFQRSYLLEHPRLKFMHGSQEYDALLQATASLP